MKIQLFTYRDKKSYKYILKLQYSCVKEKRGVLKWRKKFFRVICKDGRSYQRISDFCGKNACLEPYVGQGTALYILCIKMLQMQIVEQQERS